MTNSFGSSSQSAGQLRDWLAKPEVKVRSYLKKPAGFVRMDRSDKWAEELKIRTQAAERILVEYLDRDEEFTRIVTDGYVTRSAEGKKIYCSVLREALREIQEKSSRRVTRTRRAGNRKLEVAA